MCRRAGPCLLLRVRRTNNAGASKKSANRANAAVNAQKIPNLWKLLKEGDKLHRNLVPRITDVISIARPVPSKLSLSSEEAEHMIEDYYEEWSWDRKTGAPTARRLAELGLTKDESPTAGAHQRG